MAEYTEPQDKLYEILQSELGGIPDNLCLVKKRMDTNNPIFVGNSGNNKHIIEIKIQDNLYELTYIIQDCRNPGESKEDAIVARHDYFENCYNVVNEINSINEQI